MPNFSFGEWYYDPASGYIRRKPNEKCIARIIGTGSEGEKNEEAKANARLITAAPDMYGLICVLMHEGIIPETLPCGYRSLKRLHGIIEAVTGNNFRWDTSPHSLNCSNFFRNYECEYFLCHKDADKSTFNCLFCYCPLYPMADCPGNHEMLPNGIKDCSNCLLPHTNYDAIIEALKEALRHD